MNAQAMMQLMAAFNTFKNNHPKFVSFAEHFMKTGVPEGSVIEISVTRPGEGSVIEISVTRPGEEPVVSNLKITQSDLDLIRSLKDIRS